MIISVTAICLGRVLWYGGRKSPSCLLRLQSSVQRLPRFLPPRLSCTLRARQPRMLRLQAPYTEARMVQQLRIRWRFLTDSCEHSKRAPLFNELIVDYQGGSRAAHSPAARQITVSPTRVSFFFLPFFPLVVRRLSPLARPTGSRRTPI